MIDKFSLTELNSELESAIRNFEQYHADMEMYRKYYMYSAFYPKKSGQSPDKSELKINLLRVFADKLINYTSGFPNIKVPTPAAEKQAREAASIREKILYGVHEKSKTKMLQKQWAKDVGVRSVAVAETTFNLKKRCVEVKRYDPRFVFWQLSNDNDRSVVAFWAVFPITKEECLKKYGFTPDGNSIGFTFPSSANPLLASIDGKDWFLQAIRWDENTRVSWVGNRIIEEPHNHQMGIIPVDICMPFDDQEVSGFGSFYLEPLIAPQAELNHIVKQRANIAQRMGNPVVWGRGIHTRQFDDVKQNLSKQGGGFVGLKQTGELGLLQVNDVKLLGEHASDIVVNMMRLSGFSAAAFGESVGANTSGDALGMYFTPTQRLIEDQNIAWAAFYKSINAKILRLYDNFLKTNETVQLSGFSPRGTVLTAGEGDDKDYQSGGFQIGFDKNVIQGNYHSEVSFPNVTPKNEVAEKKFWIEAANMKIISRTTAYENIGLDSPEDELALLTQEQQEPALNPQGTQQMMDAATKAGQLSAPGGLLGVPSPTPPVQNEV